MNQTPVWLPPERRSFWGRLSPIQRVGLIGAALILPCCGGLTVIGALAGGSKPASINTPAAEQLAGAAGDPTAGDPTAAAPTTPAAGDAATTPAANPVEKTTIKTVKVTKAVAYSTRNVDDDDLEEGRTRVRTKGVNGVRTLTYQVTYADGRETGRELVSDVLTTKPVTKVVAVGTKTTVDSECDPNYDPCVPVASDVDCAGGSGNGPAYVDGPVRVIGDDPYDLDRDGDGIACDR